MFIVLHTATVSENNNKPVRYIAKEGATQYTADGTFATVTVLHVFLPQVLQHYLFLEMLLLRCFELVMWRNEEYGKSTTQTKGSPTAIAFNVLE